MHLSSSSNLSGNENRHGALVTFNSSIYGISNQNKLLNHYVEGNSIEAEVPISLFVFGLKISVSRTVSFQVLAVLQVVATLFLSLASRSFQVPYKML